MALSEQATAALAAITETAAVEIEKLDTYWQNQIPPTDPGPEPGEDITTIGMSAEKNLWDERLESVGADGITARRIFAQLSFSGDDQEGLIRDAYAAGMLPVVSYKVPNVNDAIEGAYDAWAINAANLLTSFDRPCVVAIWHEPHGDMSAGQFVAMQERLMPFFNVGKLIPGPILNGWLLDNRRDDFQAYMNDHLLSDLWTFVGIDTYQPDEGDTIPGDRIPLLIDLLNDMGYHDMPVGVGEYNGHDEHAIAASGEIFLAETRCRFACVWNSARESGTGFDPLEGARLEAFKATKADPRARQSWGAYWGT